MILDDENQKLSYQLSKDKNMNSRENLSHSLKQQNMIKKKKTSNHLSTSKLSLNTTRHLNQLQTDIMNVKIPTNSRIYGDSHFIKNRHKKSNAQKSLLNQKLNNSRYSQQK